MSRSVIGELALPKIAIFDPERTLKLLGAEMRTETEIGGRGKE